MRFFKTLFERLWPRAQHAVSHSALATNEDADLACLEVPTPIPAEAVQIRREENGFPAPPSLSVDRWFYPWLLSCPDFIDKPLTDPERKILTAFDLLQTVASGHSVCGGTGIGRLNIECYRPKLSLRYSKFNHIRHEDRHRH